MVKSKDDYNKRMDDSRFREFDKVLDPSYGRKQYNILITGLLIVCIIFAATTLFNINSHQDTSTKILYEDGLNISYIPDTKLFTVTFTNPKLDTQSMMVLIKVPYDSMTTNPYLNVYDYSTSEFPSNITYSPSQKLTPYNHIIIVTLVKETGNYTYVYSTTPDVDNKMWEGTGQYINKITEVFNKS